MFFLTQFYEVLLEFLAVATAPYFPEEFKLIWKLVTFTPPFF